ncbi:MAG: hypothetical protein HYS81_01130 [Candidatus Aenigmatarchaeota archaeon]|nr:MAG: hypothetical protein HYS81_01130 [Candidatus Aenigmarchaeota archaeon]
MKGVNPTTSIAAMFVIILVVLAIAAYALAGAPHEADLTGPLATSFTIQSVRDSTVLVRNDGTEEIRPGSVRLLVNGRAFAYEQAEPIAPGRTGELVLQLVPGPCRVKIEGVSSFSITSAEAELCVYNEEFNEQPDWQTEGVTLNISNGNAVVRNMGTGLALDRTIMKRGAWILATKMKGDSPQVAFLQNDGGYAFGVSDRNAATTEIAFWKGDVKKGSATYEWKWDPQKWYLFEVSSEGDGTYFGKAWAEGTQEPDEWDAFLIDSQYTEGSVGIVVDAAGEKTETDYIRIRLPEAP